MSETKEPKKPKLYNNRLDRSMAPVFRALTRALGMPDAIEYDDHFSAEEPNRPGQFESWDSFNKSVDKWYDATNTGHSVCVPNPRYCPDPEYFGLGEKKEEKPEPKKTTVTAAELKNNLRCFEMLVAGMNEDEKIDKKTLGNAVIKGLESLMQIIDDLQIHKESKEEKAEREAEEFKNILDSI